MLREIADFTNEVQATGIQLSMDANQMAEITERTKYGVDGQRQATHQAATAMTEMAATANEVAAAASNAASETAKASERSYKGKALVKQTIGSMQLMSGHMQEVTQLVQHLEQQTEQIGSVLNVIGGIAEQTNLLALNAAIEAARAGDQGRGFAVVADEVRTLAQRTQTSTTEIETMISTLQSATIDLVNAMKRGAEAADLGLEHAANTDSSLSGIADAIATIESVNTQVATAAEEQSSVSAEINANIVNIHDGAEVAAEMANNLQTIAQQTRQAAQRMQEIAVRFHV